MNTLRSALAAAVTLLPLRRLNLRWRFEVFLALQMGDRIARKEKVVDD